MTPYAHQLKPISVLVDSIRCNRAALDASDTGVGKTAHALFAAKETQRRVAVICPKSVKPSWERMAQAIGVETVLVENVEQLKARQENLQGDGKRWAWKLPACVTIFDECHRFAGYNTENGVIMASAPKPMLMLSATCASDPTRMRAIAHQLGLAKWNDWYSWCARNGCKKGYWGGIEFRGTTEHLDRLHRSIFKSGLGIRVRQNEIEGFPPNLIEAVTVPVENQKAIDEAYRAELEALETNAPNAAVLSLRARQISEHEKLPALLELTQDLLDSGNSIAIFINFRDSLDRLRKVLRCPSIYGGQKQNDRQAGIDLFNENSARVIVCMIAAGGEAVSLPDRDGQHPRVQLIFPGVSARELVQAQGRCPRADGKGHVITKLIFAAATAEEKIFLRVQEKIRNQIVINDGDLMIRPQVARKLENIHTLNSGTLTDSDLSIL